MGAAATASLVATSLSNIAAGSLLERFSARAVILFGAALALAGSLVAAQSINETWFICGFVLIGLGMGAGTTVASIPSLSMLFSRERGMALGIYFGSLSLACAIMPLVTRTLIEDFSWRFSLQVVGFLTMAVASSFIFLKTPSAADGDDLGATDQPVEGGLSVREAMRAPNYWVFVLAVTMALMGVQGVLFGVVLFLVDGGMNASLAVDVFSFVNLLAVPASPLLGLLVDRFGARTVAPVGLLVQGIGTACLLGASMQAGMGWAAIAGFSLFWGVGCLTAGQVGPVLLEDIVGLRHFAPLLGINTAIAGLLSAAAPMLTEYIRAATHNYHLAFWLYGGMSIAAAPLFWLTTARAATWKGSSATQHS